MQRLILFLAVSLLLMSSARAEAPSDPILPAATTATTEPPTPIQDNSFLVEEAYNQEDGVIQHISFVQPLSTGDWAYTQTDEWPLRSLKHQLSLTVGLNHAATYGQSGPGWGDTAINYRYQLVGSGETRLAIAPRISLLAPTGDSTVGRGYGGWGLQTNVPVSFQHNSHLVTHWNAGLTWIPSQQNALHQHATALNPNLGQSTVWLVKPRFNALCEVVWSYNAVVTGPDQIARTNNVYISPGIRWAQNFKNGLQIVPGVAVPFGFADAQHQKGVILYLSFEHGFRPAHSRQ
jgi:hypothetical protein